MQSRLKNVDLVTKCFFFQETLTHWKHEALEEGKQFQQLTIVLVGKPTLDRNSIRKLKRFNMA